MSGVFLDTVGLVGLWDEDDQWHLPAAVAFAGLRQRRERLFTTSYIVAECANATARWIERKEIDTLLRTLARAGGLIFPSDADWAEAWKIYAGQRPGAPGLVDEISFAIMRRLGLRRAFTNDRHFVDAGFEPMF